LEPPKRGGGAGLAPKKIAIQNESRKKKKKSGKPKVGPRNTGNRRGEGGCEMVKPHEGKGKKDSASVGEVCRFRPQRTIKFVGRINLEGTGTGHSRADPMITAGINHTHLGAEHTKEEGRQKGIEIRTICEGPVDRMSKTNQTGRKKKGKRRATRGFP